MTLADQKIIMFYGLRVPDYSGACHCKVQEDFYPTKQMVYH